VCVPRSLFAIARDLRGRSHRLRGHKAHE
jgi:hypothetical protein